MAKAIATTDVEIDGSTTRVIVRPIDLVRYEQLFQQSVTKFDSMTDLYRISWIAMRRANVAGIPDTFDAFLALEPDISEVGEPEEDAGGKVSVPAPGISSSQDLP